MPQCNRTVKSQYMADYTNLINFDNPGHLKVALLSQGVSIKSQSVFSSTQYAENQFPYGYSSDYVKNYTKIPGEIILPQEVYCGLQLRKDSPWQISMKQAEFLLKYKDKVISPIKFIPKPKFYGKLLSSGQPCEKIAVLYGNKHILSFFTRGYCYYFSVNKQCKFCSLNPTRDSLGKDNSLFVKPEEASEATSVALKLYADILYVNHCSGTHKNNDLGLKFQMDILKAIVSVTPKNIKQHMLTMPPDNLELLRSLKAAGLDTVNFALEVYDKKIFEDVCSGKNTLYGRSKFFRAFKKAVEVFGRGNSYCNFVGGLESIESMQEGFERLASQGTAPSINVFHPDPRSKLSNRPTPTIKYLLRLGKIQSDIYKKYNFNPIYPVGGTRNSLDTESWNGYFN